MPYLSLPFVTVDIARDYRVPTNLTYITNRAFVIRTVKIPILLIHTYSEPPIDGESGPVILRTFNRYYRTDFPQSPTKKHQKTLLGYSYPFICRSPSKGGNKKPKKSGSIKKTMKNKLFSNCTITCSHSLYPSVQGT
jgi:hypothetical protein